MGKIVTKSINRTYKNLIKQVIKDLGEPIQLFYDPDIAKCPNCFLSGTLIDTPVGLREIQDISIGDIIYDGFGKERAVSGTLKRFVASTFTTIKTHTNSIGLTGTSNHKVLVYENEGSSYFPIVGSSREKELKDVKKGDILFTPVRKLPETPLECIMVDWKKNRTGPQKNLDPKIPVGKEFLFSIGLWLAEGVTSKGRQSFYCLNEHEIDIGNRVGSYWSSLLDISYSIGRLKDSSKNAVFELYSSHLADFLDKFCGHGCSKKYINNDLYYSLDREQALSLLEGFFVGDGHFTTTEYNDYWTVTTTSKILAYQTYNLLLSCGYRTSIRRSGDKIGNDGIYRRPAYTVQYHPYSTRAFIRTETGVFQVVKSVETSALLEEVVYNLEVTTEHSYIADGFSVKNCFMDPVSGKSKNIFDTSFVTPVVIFATTINPTSFQRGRCPICKGEGQLFSYTPIIVQAIVKWRPNDSKMERTVAGDEGTNIVRVKARKTYYEKLRDCRYAYIDGVKCELVRPPTLRGLGKIDEVVVAFFEAVEVGKSVKE